MNLRLTGTTVECTALAGLLADLAAAGVLTEVGTPSRPYPNRPPSTHVRVYLDLTVPTPGPGPDVAGRSVS